MISLFFVSIYLYLNIQKKIVIFLSKQQKKTPFQLHFVGFFCTLGVHKPELRRSKDWGLRTPRTKTGLVQSLRQRGVLSGRVWTLGGQTGPVDSECFHVAPRSPRLIVWSLLFSGPLVAARLWVSKYASMFVLDHRVKKTKQKDRSLPECGSVCRFTSVLNLYFQLRTIALFTKSKAWLIASKL